MKIGIIGCGWVGKPLALALKTNAEVLGTTTQEDKAQELQKQGINASVFLLDNPVSDLSDEWKQLDWLIYTVPPSATSAYVEQSSELIRFLVSNHPTLKLIYTSTTGVYGNQDKRLVETTERNPQRNSAKLASQLEDFILKNYAQRALILRLAGLVGEQRQLGRYFAGRKDIANGQQPVNLVHLEDVVAVIQTCLTQHIHTGVYNVCSDEHPTKAQYYTAVCKALGLEQPHFNPNDNKNTNRVVDTTQLKNKLNYKFIHPNPMTFPLLS